MSQAQDIIDEIDPDKQRCDECDKFQYINNRTDYLIKNNNRMLCIKCTVDVGRKGG